MLRAHALQDVADFDEWRGDAGRLVVLQEQ
jgi:hypothetical protein